MPVFQFLHMNRPMRQLVSRGATLDELRVENRKTQDSLIVDALRAVAAGTSAYNSVEGLEDQFLPSEEDDETEKSPAQA
jgi:hypothetical protein